MFTEEIPDARDPEKTLIVLGGTDIIVDAKVSRYETPDLRLLTSFLAD